jgi:hypothetical protein
MRTFNLSDNYSIECRSEATRNGFRHIAVLRKDFKEIDRTKICYINRTWERYEFESVKDKILDRNKEIKDKIGVLNKLEDYKNE